MRRNVFTTYDPNLPMGKKFVAVHVQNEDPLYFLVEVKSKVCELFVQISKFLNLLEPELFGLAIKSSEETFIFLDPLKKLSKYAPKPWKTQNNGMDNDGLPLFNVFFRVQFYVDSYLFISCKVAKFYYYHQLRENVLRYDQAMSEERAFLLASYALQADYGNYNVKLHKNRYFDPSHYFPSWVIEELGNEYIQQHLPSLHCDHKGMSKSEAQSLFIREASDPMAAHNFHLYKMVSNKKASSCASSDTWLAITITGLMIYAAEPLQSSCRHSLKTRISFFPWSDIGKLSFDKKKFEIRSIGPQSRKFIYYTGSEELARFLLWFSRASHQFHLMILPKMREMLKREAEINRRKYRENCISSTSSRNSSCGNSSGTCGMSGSSSSSNPNNNNTSKSVSPFEFSSSASSSSGSGDAKKCGTSDLDISSSSVCCGMMDCGDSTKDPGEEDQDQQRVSVISNASSNTTSGIASDKMHSGLGEEDSDPESDLLMSLNGHHHHRAITLSGCSPQPVVSMESLALSEPINDHHQSCHPSHPLHHPNHVTKSAMMRNKKHSISISNIMITTTEGSFTSSCSGSGSTSQVKTTVNTSPPTDITATTTEVIVNGEKSSKVSLCLNINESQYKSSNSKDNSNVQNSDNSNSDDDSSYDDEIDSAIDHRYHHGHGSGKSNVTVLSTILKPEAERLLKQGIEADDVIAFNTSNDDGIDSLELAELKEFEQAEKEKIILNSLIDNIPPPPPLTSSMDSSDSDGNSHNSDSDSSDDDDDNDFQRQLKLNRHHYSPLAQEKRLHNREQQHQRNTNSNSSPSKNNVIPSRLRSKSSSASVQPLAQESNTFSTATAANKNLPQNHIYENIPVTGSSKFSQVVQALVATPNNKHHTGFPPTISLRPYPSLNSVPFGQSESGSNYLHRTGMRIGVSSLSRPGSAQKNAAHLLLQGGCVHSSNLKSSQNIPASTNFGQISSLLSSSNLSAGSEPNLYFGSALNNKQQTTMPPKKSDAVYNCPHIVNESICTEQSTPQSQTDQQQSAAACTFRKFIQNQLESPQNNGSSSKLMLDLSMLQQQHTANGRIPSNTNRVIVPNTDSVYITPPPSADYHQKSLLEQLPPNPLVTKTPTSHQLSNNHISRSNCSEESALSLTKKSKESRLKELRQRTSDLNLPLITALFNDSSLKLSDRFMDQPPKSKSMQHLTPPSNHFINGSCSSGCTSSSSSLSTHSRASPATVERSCTFRVDEAIAKSALRQSNCKQNDANNNISQHFGSDFRENYIGRPTSWHVGNSLMTNQTYPVINQPNGWRQYLPTIDSNQQQLRRLSTGNGVIPKNTVIMIQPSTNHQLYHRAENRPTGVATSTTTMWIDSPITTS